MKTVVYYFTGTGNSLAAAKKMATELGNCDCVPIAPLKNTTGDVVPPAGRVGIVCPVYDVGLPGDRGRMCTTAQLRGNPVRLWPCDSGLTT